VDHNLETAGRVDVVLDGDGSLRGQEPHGQQCRSDPQPELAQLHRVLPVTWVQSSVSSDGVTVLLVRSADNLDFQGVSPLRPRVVLYSKGGSPELKNVPLRRRTSKTSHAWGIRSNATSHMRRSCSIPSAWNASSSARLLATS